MGLDDELADRSGGMSVKHDELFGPTCSECNARGHAGILYVTKIDSGPRGTRITYRHVERNPGCGESKVVERR